MACGEYVKRRDAKRNYEPGAPNRGGAVNDSPHRQRQGMNSSNYSGQL